MTGGDSDFVAKSLLNPGTPDSSDTDTPDWSLTEAFWSRAGQAYWAAPLIRDILGALLVGALAWGLCLSVLLTSFNSEAARKVTLSAQATKASFAPFPSPSPSPSPSTTEGFHPAAVCDKTGQGPTIGWLFHLTGENYDLCESSYEKASYESRLDCWAEIAEATRREVKETRKLLAEAVEKGEKFASYVAKKREGWRKLLLAKAKRDRRQARQQQ